MLFDLLIGFGNTFRTCIGCFHHILSLRLYRFTICLFIRAIRLCENYTLYYIQKEPRPFVYQVRGRFDKTINTTAAYKKKKKTFGRTMTIRRHNENVSMLCGSSRQPHGGVHCQRPKRETLGRRSSPSTRSRARLVRGRPGNDDGLRYAVNLCTSRTLYTRAELIPGYRETAAVINPVTGRRLYQRLQCPQFFF